VGAELVFEVCVVWSEQLALRTMSGSAVSNTGGDSNKTEH
jgi:hypothetical protein